MFNFIKKLFTKKHRVLETERLVLRKWTLNDAEALFKFASDSRVGPNAGWFPHKSIEESKYLINTLFNDPNIFAIVPKKLDYPIGAISLTIGSSSNLPLPNSEAEIGYWIGAPFWGQGITPEATLEIIRYGFEDLKLKQLWCGYFEGNKQSKRVQEKCGFRYRYVLKDQLWRETNEIKTEHITSITKEEYLERKRSEQTS